MTLNQKRGNRRGNHAKRSNGGTDDAEDGFRDFYQPEILALQSDQHANDVVEKQAGQNKHHCGFGLIYPCLHLKLKIFRKDFYAVKAFHENSTTYQMTQMMKSY